MKATLKLVKIDHSLIKEPTWIVFGRNNGIYKASTTYDWLGEKKTTSPGEFYIEHISDKSEWRFVKPDDPDRIEYDYFQKVVAEIESGDANTYQIDVRFSEWQLIVTCLLGRKVEVDYTASYSRVKVKYIYSHETTKLEEALLRIRAISQPHWTEHEHWNEVCEIAKDATISQKDLRASNKIAGAAKELNNGQ
jgi:hypothetical protein